MVHVAAFVRTQLQLGLERLLFFRHASALAQSQHFMLFN